MKKIASIVLLPLCLGSCGGPVGEEPPTVTQLMSQPLPDMPGKEAVMLLVEFGPGAVDPVHRHDAHGLIYVVEGSVVMQVKGAEAVTLTPGETFYEGPSDVHVVGRNASTTKPAKIVAVLIKNVGTPAFIPEPHGAGQQHGGK